jgi:hypothetical protein
LDCYLDDARTWNNRGTAYVASKLFRLGIRDYTEAIARTPNCADFYYKVKNKILIVYMLKASKLILFCSFY